MNRSLGPPSGAPIEARGVSRRYRDGFRALHDVSFSVGEGEIVALVGESGSGKSTLGRILAHLDAPTAGEVWLDGKPLATLTGAARRRVQLVLQDPFASLNPALTVGHTLGRALALAGVREVDARVRTLLTTVGLPPDVAERLPGALSGGQRQRVSLARALAVEPRVLIADEPTSMLDVSLRAGVLELIADARTSRGLACVFITHDLPSARALADRVLVLYAGVLVEEGPTEDVLRAPAHPYTALLVAAACPERLREELPAREGGRATQGCAFRPRCPIATDQCSQEPPAQSVGPGREVRCHHPLASPGDEG